ncbi:hypothetical protein [Polyangium jinanense]|uniref:Uncharacterized protein n=1 Tax=Polyangium jinanense TaxID=2829994 RepID=A0A9X4AWG1_9BACT|nr:hypothetical protein [Polyangium jinanense]MDC3987304.1 hypothetical protein [Polyangium jinanense]
MRLDHDPGERRERREDGRELVLVHFTRAARARRHRTAASALHRGALVLGLVRLDHDPGERRERREDGRELVLVHFTRAARLDARGRPRAPCIEAPSSSASARPWGRPPGYSSTVAPRISVNHQRFTRPCVTNMRDQCCMRATWHIVFVQHVARKNARHEQMRLPPGHGRS